MKLRNFALGFALLAMSLYSVAQQGYTTPIANNISNSVGVYNALAYAWSGNVFGGGSTAGGTYTVTLYSPAVTLPDGRRVAVFANTAATTANIAIPQITIGNLGAGTQETVTPSSVSGCTSLNAGADTHGTCQITATFTYAHGKADYIGSGDYGWQEAMNDAANNGGGQVNWSVDCGIITLSTSGATTTSTCFIPKSFTNLGGSAHVTTTITTSASYSVGISGATTAFIASCTSLTAGQGCAYFQTTPTSVLGSAGEGALLVTANATAGAGAVHVKVWGMTQAQSAF